VIITVGVGVLPGVCLAHWQQPYDGPIGTQASFCPHFGFSMQHPSAPQSSAHHGMHVGVGSGTAGVSVMTI
jgi:hypothetical protein